jgi:hypothetical protein
VLALMGTGVKMKGRLDLALLDTAEREHAHDTDEREDDIGEREQVEDTDEHEREQAQDTAEHERA